jgi:hypothetical protein
MLKVISASGRVGTEEEAGDEPRTVCKNHKYIKQVVESNC